MAGPHDSLSVRHCGASPGSHAHAHFQILLGLGGVLELDVGGHGQRVGTGDGLVIAPGDRHDVESTRGAHCLVLDSDAPAWARQLRAQGMPVAEVARRSGYRSPSALTAALRRSAPASPAPRDD